MSTHTDVHSYKDTPEYTQTQKRVPSFVNSCCLCRPLLYVASGHQRLPSTRNAVSRTEDKNITFCLVFSLNSPMLAAAGPPSWISSYRSHLSPHLSIHLPSLFVWGLRKAQAQDKDAGAPARDPDGQRASSVSWTRLCLCLLRCNLRIRATALQGSGET